jgi:hypothetical protein
MRRLLIAATVIAIAQLGPAQAASPFDGQWKGGSASGGGTSGGHKCPATTATVTIKDGKITGSYSSQQYTFNIAGFVKPDGTATGKWSAYGFNGTFSGTHFKGTYSSKECGSDREIYLDKQS